MGYWNNNNDSYIEKYIFDSALHTFRAVVNKYEDTIRIGGKYEKCVLLTANVNGNPEIASLDHVQSEPECTIDAMLEDHQASEMMKASIQFCKHLYPATKYIEFSDASHIDCKKTPGGKPPRKQKKPFSLAHLSIATNASTWYEKIFGARYKYDALQNTYIQNKSTLDNSISMTFKEFVEMNNLTDAQTSYIKPLYESASSWRGFFNAVPKSDRCDTFFNWLPTFINYLINNSFNMDGWVIDYDAMPKTELKNIRPDTTKGGKYTRKHKKRGTFVMRHYKASHVL